MKLANFVSNARLGSRIAIKSASGDLSFKAGEVGADLDPFVPQAMARGAQLLEHAAPAARSPLMRECRAIGVDDGLPRSAWWAKTASARALSGIAPA